MPLAAIGFGANVGDAHATFARALRELRGVGRIRAVSPRYRTRPWGVDDQPDFLNAVVLVHTQLRPRALLRALQALERRLGRQPSVRWGPRAIDLDILTYGERVVDEPDLRIPHARLLERAFVLAPLADLDSRFAAALAALPATERAGVQRIPSPAARSARSVDWDQTLERVRSAAAFCADAQLSRFRIDEPDIEIDVRRTPRSPAPTASPNGVAHERTGDGPPASANGATDAAAADGPRSVLKAEFVGIVRLSRPAVSPGAVLAQDRELAYVESLGIRNPVRAGGPGRVVEVFVSDGQAVEYGQPLFAIEPARH